MTSTHIWTAVGITIAACGAFIIFAGPQFPAIDPTYPLCASRPLIVNYDEIVITKTIGILSFVGGITIGIVNEVLFSEITEKK